MGGPWYASKENVFVACRLMTLGECYDINGDAAVAASLNGKNGIQPYGLCTD